MKIAVTGSAGFTGLKLVNKLESFGHEIVKLDITEGIDITDFNKLNDIPEFEVIYHLAAKSFVPDSYKNPLGFYQMNFNSTLNTLELAKKFNAKYVFVSSYVYGTPQYLPIDENHPTTSFNPYADTKILGENLCRSYNKFFNMKVMIVRPFNIYGPNQTNNFLVPFIVNQAVSGKVELSDPRPKRDLIFIDDLVELYARLADYNKSDFEIFNAGFGKSYSVKEIVDSLICNFPNKIEVNFLNIERPNEVMDTVAKVTKAKRLLDWEPKVDMNEGLYRIYSSLKK